MKKIIIVLGFGLCVFALLNGRSAKQDLPLQERAIQREGLLTSAKVLNLSGEATLETQEDRDIPVSIYFPKAKIVSSVSEVEEDNEKIIETLETTSKEPFVRVERVIRKDAISGEKILASEVAMVANQILLERPDSLSEEKFQEILSRAGALRVKELGGAFLATFEARPEDPNALHSYIARVRELSEGTINIEPNYIRKAF